MRVFQTVGMVLVASALGRAAAAQRARPATPPVDSTVVVNVRLSDGSTLTGRIVAADDSSLVIVTTAGIRAAAPRRSIVGWTPLQGRIHGQHFYENDPNTSRLFFSPTGRTIAAGSGYFADYYLLFPFLAYGITDRFTVAGGVSLIPGASDQLWYLSGKVGVVRAPEVNVAVGGLYTSITGQSHGAGIVYGVGTFGNQDNAFTAGAGYPFADGRTTDTPIWMLGGEGRIGGGTKLLAEAWKLPGASDIPVIFGLRFFGRKLAVDFGLLGVLGAHTEGFPFLPWVDFAVRF